ncbi:MAG: CHAT domain-containing protein [Gammaproteobacteria bacterium]
MSERGQMNCRPIGLSILLLVCAVFAVAEPADHWLQPQGLAEVPSNARSILIDALNDEAKNLGDEASCIELLRDHAQMRPSVEESVCGYIAFELAAVHDTMVARSDEFQTLQAQVLDMDIASDVGGWRQFVAIQSGWLQRLAAHPPPENSAATKHPALRGWSVIRALDRGDLATARAAQMLLGDPSCPRSCAQASLTALARGMLAFHDAKRERAIELAEQAAEHLTRSAKQQPRLAALLAPEVALLLDELAQTARRDEVLVLAQQVAERVLPPQHAARRHLGATRLALLANEGHTEAAKKLYASLQSTHGDRLLAYPLTAARLRLGEGVQQYMRADYEQAVAAALGAREVARRAWGSDAPLLAEALNVVGLARGTSDQNELAIEAYRTALSTRERIFARGHPLVSEINNNLSVVFHNMGRYDLAESFVQRSLAADREFYGDHHEEVASALYNLAAVHRAMGEPLRAIELLQEAVMITSRRLGEQHRRTAIMHFGLGRAYMEHEDHRAALNSFETSARLHQARDPKNRDVPIARHQVAVAALALGEYERARETLQTVLQRYQAIYGPAHRHVAAAYRDLADAEQKLGRTAAADANLMASLVALAAGDALEVRWRSWFALATHEYTGGRPEAAIFFAKMALETLQTLRASQGTLGRRLQRAFARRRADTYRDTAVWLADEDRLLEAQRVLDMLKDEEYFDFTRRSTSTQRKMVFTLPEQAARERLLAAQKALRNGDADAAAYRAALAMERQRLSVPREENEPVASAPPRPLAPGHAALYFVVSASTTQVIATTMSQAWRHELPLGKRQIAARVLTLREALASPQRDPLTSSKALYQDLLGPLVEKLEASTPSVTFLHVYLDASLRYLPLSALHDGERFLTEKFTLSRATVAPQVTTSAQRPGRVAAFATSRALAGFPALPATLAEVDAIVRRESDDSQGAFPGGIWADDEFDRDALFTSLQTDFDRVHVASHFRFVPGNERESFLLLGDGQKLSLQDLRDANLSLDGLELLALSGCETALATPGADGREMDGFAQTAQRRGARHVVATLWAVEDAATAEFMTAFYQQQSKGDDAVVALRKTQRQFAHRHPYYWAPFVVWGPVSSQ